MMLLERPAKILILGEAAAIHTRRWVEYFRRRGWTVRWLSYGIESQSHGAEVIPQSLPYRAPAIPLSVPYVRRVIREFHPDIISALFLPDYGWLAGMCDHHPLAVSAWGSDILISPGKSPLHRRRIRYVLGKADLLFADAELLGRALCDHGAAREKIHIIPLGVEEEWLEIGHNRTDPTNRPINILTNRRLEPLYRVDTFIQAAAELHNRQPDCYQFDVVGDGSRKKMLMQLAAEANLGDRLRFSGQLSTAQLHQSLAQADLFVSCASSDGTSVSLLEAMAAGSIPIVTDLEVNREWIEPGVNGYLFPVEDHSALARIIRQAVSDCVQWPEIRRRNREIIQKRALWRDNMAVVEDIMIETIERRQEGDTR